jgi:LTXXQ motif family protein
MFSFTHPAARAATVAATLLGTIVLAGPLFAAPSDPSRPASANSSAAHMVLAQASAEAMTAPPISGEAVTASSDRIESRIKELHKMLHVTAAQEAPWKNLTQVMRDNAQVMVALQNQRVADTQSMNAVDSVKSYASVIDAHRAGMMKFVPAFTAFYDSLSDAQRKTADSMFRSRARVEEKKASKATS